MAPVAARLAELLGRPVASAGDCVGPAVEAAAAALGPGEVLLLENLRFHAEETANDPGFAARLAALAEVYVNDAFGTAHRAHASTEGVAHLLPAVAGLLMTRELEMLGALLARAAAALRRRAGRSQGLRQDRRHREDARRRRRGADRRRHVLHLLQGRRARGRRLALRGRQARRRVRRSPPRRAPRPPTSSCPPTSSSRRPPRPARRPRSCRPTACPPTRWGSTSDRVTAAAFAARDRRGRHRLLERPDGPVRDRRLRRRHAGRRRGRGREPGRDRRRGRRLGRRPAPLRPRGPHRLTCRPAAGRRWNSSRARRFPASRPFWTGSEDERSAPPADGGQLEDVQDAARDAGLLRRLRAAGRRRRRPRRARLPAGPLPRGGRVGGGGHGDRRRRPDDALRRRGRLHRRDRRPGCSSSWASRTSSSGTPSGASTSPRTTPTWRARCAPPSTRAGPRALRGGEPRRARGRAHRGEDRRAGRRRPRRGAARRARRDGGRLRAHLGDRHRPHGDPRGRAGDHRRRCAPACGLASATPPTGCASSTAAASSPTTSTS